MRSLLFALLLALSGAALSASYMTCPAGQADGTACTSGQFHWHDVGTYPPTDRVYYGNTAASGYNSGAFYKPWNYSGTITYTYQCSIHPPDGSGCGGGTATFTNMTVSSPVTCIPSGRTIDPCPSGYAPSVVPGTSSSAGDSYSSAYEKLPMQDMLYAIGIAICGLLGIGVGTKLV